MPSIDIEVADEQVARLDRLATAVRKTRREAAACLLEEALRREEFPLIEFRDSAAGRQAYVAGSGLAVWEFVMVAESYGLDVDQVARHFEWPRTRVERAISYYRAYPGEIDGAIRANDAITEEEMRLSLPNANWT